MQQSAAWRETRTRVAVKVINHHYKANYAILASEK